MCLILQLLCCRTLPIRLQIAFQYHGPVKGFSKSWILLFYGLNTGLPAPAGAGSPGETRGCRVSGSGERLLQTPARAWSCVPARHPAWNSAFLAERLKKSLADVAQHRQALTTQAVVVFNVPPCLNLTIKPLVSLLGGSQAKVLKTVQSRTVAFSEHQPDLRWGSRRDEHAHLQGKGGLYPPTPGNTACPNPPSGSSALLSVGRKQRAQVIKAEVWVPACPEQLNHNPTCGKASATAGAGMVSALLMSPLYT